MPVETPDTTSFLRNALGGCAVLFTKVVLLKAVLFKPAGRWHREDPQAGRTAYAPDRGGCATHPQQADL